MEEHTATVLLKAIRSGTYAVICSCGNLTDYAETEHEAINKHDDHVIAVATAHWHNVRV